MMTEMGGAQNDRYNATCPLAFTKHTKAFPDIGKYGLRSCIYKPKYAVTQLVSHIMFEQNNLYDVVQTRQVIENVKIQNIRRFVTTRPTSGRGTHPVLYELQCMNGKRWSNDFVLLGA